MNAQKLTALMNAILDREAEEEYDQVFMAEIQMEQWLCEEWICKEPGEDLIRFDYIPHCPEQFSEYRLAMIDDRLRLIDFTTFCLLMRRARDCITQQGMMIRDDLYGPVKRFYTPYYIRKQ
jgi:hypothetical protein